MVLTLRKNDISFLCNEISEQHPSYSLNKRGGNTCFPCQIGQLELFKKATKFSKDILVVVIFFHINVILTIRRYNSSFFALYWGYLALSFLLYAQFFSDHFLVSNLLVSCAWICKTSQIMRATNSIHYSFNNFSKR